MTGAAREFEYSREDFERVRALIYRHAGISLADSKQEMVYSRLSRRLRTTGVQKFSDYLAQLESRDTPEWEAFINSLTTNLTSFFREQHHFPILASRLLQLGTGRSISIWCCACSTGEEPYSIAITAAETFGTMSPPVRILATDLDTQVLAKAEAGVYPAERVERLSPERLKNFFFRGTALRAGSVKVRPQLRNLVTFRQLNLLDEHWALRGPFDAIFCRNVMIYFDKPTQYRILQKFVPVLREDGLLFAGHSESLLFASDLFRLRGKTVYQPFTGQDYATGRDGP